MQICIKEFEPTKNESSNRVIAVDPKTMSIFKNYFNETPHNIKRLVFYSAGSKYKVLSHTTVNKTYKKNLISMTKITYHGLRHTHASVLI